MDSGETTCWQCGAPAVAGAAWVCRLTAASSRGLDARGCEVKRGRLEDRVWVRVPRCRACQGRAARGIFAVFSGAAVGGIAGAALPSVLWRAGEAPAWLLEHGRRSAVSNATGIGTLAGLVAAMVLVWLVRRGSGVRRVDNYPAVRMLMREGWHWPASSPPG